MNEIESETSCCKDAGTECNCEKPAGRKPIKVVISLAVLLAVISIIAYKIVITNYGDNAEAGTNSFASILPFLGTTPGKSAAIRVDQNLGEYLQSLSELNTVAMDNDTVFVYIPDSVNSLIDSKAKDSIDDVQNYLKRSNIAVGLYTLSHNSSEYSEIAKQVSLPVLMVANKGSGAIVIPGGNIDEYTLLNAYQACCDASSGCCP